MKILTVIGRKTHTLSLILAYYRLHKRGVGVYELERFDNAWFRGAKIETVIDVGANTGQFSLLVRNLLPTAKIIAFEPIPKCHIALNESFKADPNFESYNMALGSESGEIAFEQNQFTPSSSILPLGKAHLQAYPFASKTAQIKVQLGRMDVVLAERTFKGELLVKIDTQGYEAQVIDGANKVIQRASCVIAEVSFKECYIGQVLFDGVYQRLLSLGLTFAGFVDQGLDPTDGSVLQANAIFIRQ